MTSADRYLRALRLARWLGPWSHAAPTAVVRASLGLAAPEGLLLAALYEPTDAAATGALLVVPGLHPSGPDDVRLDRFCRVLAASGLLVLAPFVRRHLALVVAEDAALDVSLALRELARRARARGLPRPGMLSISFGSLPALRVAASPEHAGEVGGLIVFGGYRDFHATVRFALTGRADDEGRALALPHDPLNTPALFINLVPHLGVEGPREMLIDAWHTMACRTWGRPHLRPAEERRPIAVELAARLPSTQRELFFVGCGLASGGEALLDEALARAGDAFAFADPTPALAALEAPLLIAHGRDDDVIPWPEARKLAHGLRPGHRVKVALSGMFGHTGSTFPGLSAIRDEAGSLRALMLGLVDAPRDMLGRGGRSG
ncbi:MAG: hypothetical protein FJ096_17890 [Deltaproteobacteria bacterium]|nr:hypothetical protein [Deltaproteobacteria bacterium]